MNIVLEKKPWTTTDFLVAMFGTLFLLHEWSPYIAHRTPSVVWAAITIVCFFVLFFACSKYEQPLRFIIPFISIYLLNIIFFNNSDILRKVAGVMLVSFYPLMTCYIINRKSRGFTYYMFFLFIALLLILGATSFMAYKINPDIVRMRMGALKEEDSVMYAIKANLNVGSFEMVYSYVVLFPLVIMVAKWRKTIFKKKVYHLISVIMIGYFLVVIYIGQHTMAMLLSVLILALFFASKNLTKRQFERGAVILSIVIIMAWGILPTLLRFAAGSMEAGFVTERLEDLALSLEGRSSEIGENSDYNARQDTYFESIKVITQYPIIGGWVAKAGSGGHSYILDNLATYGLLGLLLILWYYQSILKMFYKPFNKTPFIYYYYCGLLCVTVCYIVNPDGLYPVVIFCLPVSCIIMNDAVARNQLNKLL